MGGLIDLLRDEQARRCAYGTREGDGRTCDCKYANPLWRHSGEVTGCPELRAAIQILAAHPDRAGQDASGAGEVELTDAEASRIVSASISPDRVLSGNNPKDETPDVLLVVVRDILADRLAALAPERDSEESR